MSKLPKSDYYVKELDAARLRGDWLVQNPCNDQTGKPISWPELIRKYMKHNPNKHAAPTIAVSEHELRSSLLAYYDDIKYSDASHSSDSARPSTPGQTVQPKPLTRSHNGVGWSTDAITDIAKRLRESADASSRNNEDYVQRYGIIALEALALWSLGRDSEAADRIKTSGYFDSRAIENLKADGHYSDYNVALILTGTTVYGLANERLHATRPSEELIQQAQVGYARAIDLHEAIRGGRRAHAMRGLPADEIESWGERALYYNALLTVREGDSGSALNALRAYQAHVSRWPADFRLPQRNTIYKTHLATLNRTARQGNYVEPTPSSASSTTPTDGLPSWREKSYNRLSILPAASRFQLHGFTPDSGAKAKGGGLLTLSGLEAGSPSDKARTVSTRRPNPHLLQRPSSAAWGAEFLVVQRAATSCLERNLDFPRAGEVNIQALEFSEELINGWKINGELGGEVADEIIDVLYKLSTLTFHSQRIVRHLFTVLVGAERYQEAARALKLYIQIVDKAQEAEAAEAASLAKEAKDTASPTSPVNGNGNGATPLPRRSSLSRKTSLSGAARSPNGNGPSNGTNGSLGRRVSFDERRPNDLPSLDTSAGAIGNTDNDSYPTFVRTLLAGARMHTRFLNQSSHGDKLARKALEIVTGDAHKAHFTSEKELVALTYRIAGYTRGALSTQESDRVRRPELQQEALTLLEESAQLDPNASETHYQLAYVQAEKRDIRAAVFSARKALELEPADVDAWHLLVLILSSQKDYKAALDLAEVALGEAETDDAADDLDGTVNVNGTAKTPAGGGHGGPTNTSAPIISRSTLLSFDYPPKPSERSHAILRLMVTHNVLQEMVEGVDAAIEGQRNLFEFFHERVSTGAIAATALPLGQTDKGAEPRAAQFGNTGRVSTFLHPTPKGTVRSTASRDSLVGSPTHGSGLGRSLSHLSSSNFSPGRARSIYSSVRGYGISPAAAPTATVSADDVDISDGNAVRLFLHSQVETAMLVSLWLLSAATFRRAKKLSDSRAAIQEAERLAPGSADVWVQLALYFNERNDISLAINTLYKALACGGNHVAASIHLARLFLSYPTKIPGTAQDAAAVVEQAKTASAVRGEEAKKAAIEEKAAAGDEKSAFEPSKAAASSAEVGESLKAKAGGAAGTSAVTDKKEHFDSAADATTSTTAKEVSATSLAEGLLTSVTATNGWDVPEAWLFLSQVAQRTDRTPRAREYLQYALGLEDTKPVRPLGVALSRALA